MVAGVLALAGGPAGPVRREEGNLKVGTDVVFSSFWLLAGSEEPGFVRDRWDNLSVGPSALVRHDLLARPPVSLLGAALAEVLDPQGERALPWPGGSGARAGAALTHDVDYPEIIRWIEAVRLLTGRSPGGLQSAEARVSALSGDLMSGLAPQRRQSGTF